MHRLHSTGKLSKNWWPFLPVDKVDLSAIHIFWSIYTAVKYKKEATNTTLQRLLKLKNIYFLMNKHALCSFFIVNN